MTLEEALEKEIFYIKYYKENGERLTNTTEGGIGGLGNKVSDEHKSKLREIMSGENNHFYGKKHSEEVLKQQSIRMTGENNPFYGRTHSEETKAKIKLARSKQVMRKGWKHTEEAKTKISDFRKTYKMSEETGRKISLKIKGRIFTEEHKLNLKKAWDKRKNKEAI